MQCSYLTRGLANSVLKAVLLFANLPPADDLKGGIIMALAVNAESPTSIDALKSASLGVCLSNNFSTRDCHVLILASQYDNTRYAQCYCTLLTLQWHRTVCEIGNSHRAIKA
jgi:hypothetical protein